MNASFDQFLRELHREEEAAIPHRRRFDRLNKHLDYNTRHDLQKRVWYGVRTEEQVAADDAALADLETQFAPQLAEQHRKERAERLTALDLPLEAGDLPMLINETIEERRTIKNTRKWVAGPKPLLILSGTTGTGKTLACADALLRTGGRYVRASAFSRLFLAQFGSEVEQRDELIACRGLLVVDDIGTEQRADLMAIGLLEALDARRRGDVGTLWVTNLSRADFEGRYPDPRLHSRIAQSGQWLVDAGEDLRRAK